MVAPRVCLAVKPDTLTDLTNQMTEKVGLVHGLPYVADRQGFAATLEQVRLTLPDCASCTNRFELLANAAVTRVSFGMTTCSCSSDLLLFYAVS